MIYNMIQDLMPFIIFVIIERLWEFMFNKETVLRPIWSKVFSIIITSLIYLILFL